MSLIKNGPSLKNCQREVECKRAADVKFGNAAMYNNPTIIAVTQQIKLLRLYSLHTKNTEEIKAKTISRLTIKQLNSNFLPVFSSFSSLSSE